MAALSEARVRAAKPAEKPYKIFDKRGLFLLVAPSGGRLWRFRYRFGGAEKLLALGSYPDTSLKRAREKRDDARSLLADGIDPSAKRQAEKSAQADSFQAVALEWLDKQAKTLAPITLKKAEWLLEFLYPEIGHTPVREVTPPQVLAALRKIEARGHHETTHRAKQRCSQVFRYAVATGRAERDVTADLRGALTAVTSQNHASIRDPAKIGQLMRAIDGYDGEATTAAALKLAALTFVRPGELRGAEWAEFDLTAAEWRIPGSRMKMGELHVVPLSTQALAILRDLQGRTGNGQFVFPSLLTRDRSMSENTVNTALRRLGYSNEEMTGHGFRSMASTSLNEQGWSPDLIELQLAHAERNKVRAAYNKAQRLAERRKMMQAWADYLDGLRSVESREPSEVRAGSP
jgi:integrase